MIHPEIGWVETVCLACRLHDHADCDGDTTWCECLTQACVKPLEQRSADDEAEQPA